MNKSETALLHTLRAAVDAVGRDSKFWSDSLRRFADKGEALLPKSQDLEEKLQYVRSIQSIYGGMGSFNDVPLEGKAEEAHDELYEKIQDVLRAYWKEAGNEHHDAGKFKLIAIGTVVKMVKGKTRYVGRDGSLTTIPDMPWVDEQTWTVESHEGPDITNMPMYVISQGSKQILIRHEAIEPVDGKRETHNAKRSTLK